MFSSGNATWAPGDAITSVKLNNIETALKALESVDALPAAGLAGRMVRLTTDGNLYLDDGAAWVKQAKDADKIGKGTANADIEQVFAMLLPVDTRSLVATAWDADSRPTTLEFRNGVTVLVTVTITYNGDGKATSVEAVGDGRTITYTLSWTGDQFNSYTKAVI